MLRERLVREMQHVAALLQLQGVRLTTAFERDLGELREAIGFLERSDLIHSRLDHRGEILYFEENRRRALDMYRNSIAHFLVIPSILARSALAGLDRRQVRAEIEVWIDVFYREYYASRELYFTRGEALLEFLETHLWFLLPCCLMASTSQLLTDVRATSHVLLIAYSFIEISLEALVLAFGHVFWM